MHLRSQMVPLLRPTYHCAHPEICLSSLRKPLEKCCIFFFSTIIYIWKGFKIWEEKFLFLLLNWAIKNFGCSPIILFASSFAHHLSKKKILLLTQCYSFLFLTIALLRPFPTSICHQPQHELPEKSLSLFFYETWLSLKKSVVRNQTKPNQWQEWEW